MGDYKVIEELESELARDEERLREIERIEERLLADIPLVGFRTATYELHLQSEREMLQDKIREKRQLLVVAKQ
jgi:hypothetical protein